MSSEPNAYSSHPPRLREATILDKIVANGGVMSIALFFIVCCLFFAVTTDAFLTAPNLLNIIRQSAPLLIVAAAMTFVITTGGIDLSVGSVLALTATLSAAALQAGVPWPLAILLMLALGGAGVLNALLKLLFQRPRPELAFVHLETYSFPSGHAAVAAATFTTLAFLLGQRAPTRRVLIALAAVALIALVGFSRLYLGVHFLSDVIAGFSAGTAWVALCVVVLDLHERWRSRGQTSL